jgi:hypothetical protein
MRDFRITIALLDGPSREPILRHLIQKVDLLKSMTGAGLERSPALEHFQKVCSSYSRCKLLRTIREGSAFRFSTNSV